MIRRLLNVATAVSLALCVATSYLWVRSHRIREDYWFSGAPSWAVGADVHRGSFVFYQISSGPYSLAPGFTRTDRTADRTPPFDAGVLQRNGYARGVSEWAGFGFVNATGAAPGFRQRFLTLPVWSVFAATGALAALGAIRLAGWRGWARRARGLCPACGYDVRMTPNRCPECGSVLVGR